MRNLQGKYPDLMAQWKMIVFSDMAKTGAALSKIAWPALHVQDCMTGCACQGFARPALHV